MLRTDYIVLRVNGRNELRHCELPDLMAPNFLHRLDDLVRGFVGQPVEHVNVFSDFNDNDEYAYRDMFVHEDGHLVGLSCNDVATAIYRANVLMHEPGKYRPESLPVIVGTAVLFRDKVWR